MVRVKFRNYCNVQLCSAHAQYDNFTVTDFSLIFREINGFAQCALVTSLTKLLLWRNFCNFHTKMCEICNSVEITEFYCCPCPHFVAKILWKQLFQKKNFNLIGLTKKFAWQWISRIPHWLWHVRAFVLHKL